MQHGTSPWLFHCIVPVKMRLNPHQTECNDEKAIRSRRSNLITLISFRYISDEHNIIRTSTLIGIGGNLFLLDHFITILEMGYVSGLATNYFETFVEKRPALQPSLASLIRALLCLWQEVYFCFCTLAPAHLDPTRRWMRR